MVGMCSVCMGAMPEPCAGLSSSLSAGGGADSAGRGSEGAAPVRAGRFVRPINAASGRAYSVFVAPGGRPSGRFAGDENGAIERGRWALLPGALACVRLIGGSADAVVAAIVSFRIEGLPVEECGYILRHS